MEAFRIIQSYHVTEHAIFIQSKGFLTGCRNTAAYYIIFLTVWNSWLRQQTSKIPSLYKVSLSFRWNDEGKQAVKTKAECFKAWRLFLCFFIPFKYALLTKREVNTTGYIWPNSCFCILLDFLKVLYLFPGWLCHETSSLGRCATSCIEAPFARC